MSMTESEAKFWLDKLHGNILRDKFVETCTENEIIALIESKIAWGELEQYRAIGTVSEFRESKNFLEFLYNAINPNEMEQYLAMYHASEEKGE